MHQIKIKTLKAALSAIEITLKGPCSKTGGLIRPNKLNPLQTCLIMMIRKGHNTMTSAETGSETRNYVRNMWPR